MQSMCFLDVFCKLWIFYLLALEDCKDHQVGFGHYVLLCFLFIKHKILFLLFVIFPLYSNNIYGIIHWVDIAVLFIVAQYDLIKISNGYFDFDYRLWIVLLYSIIIITKHKDQIPVFYVAYMSLIFC